MTATDVETTAKAPRLVLTLPGTWVQIDASRPTESLRRIDTFVERAMGRADELAQMRAAMREALGTLMERSATDGAAGAAQSVFVCDEIAKGTKMPMCISVFSPESMRISPAVGTEPEAVIDTFLDALKVTDDAEGWEKVACRDGMAVRRWHLTEQPLDPEFPDQTMTSWVVDYWRTVPGSKKLVLITGTSPLSDIPQTLIHLTDAVIGTSRFATPW